MYMFMSKSIKREKRDCSFSLLAKKENRMHANENKLEYGS